MKDICVVVKLDTKKEEGYGYYCDSSVGNIWLRKQIPFLEDIWIEYVLSMCMVEYENILKEKDEKVREKIKRRLNSVRNSIKSFKFQDKFLKKMKYRLRNTRFEDILYG